MGKHRRFIKEINKMRIKQCKMLNSKQEKVFNNFFKEYRLKKYNNFNKPSIFFSLWEYRTLKEHKSFALIIWRGSDVLRMGNKLETIKKRKNTFHIAISSYVAKDLKRYNINHKFIPVIGANMKYFKPTLLGNEIYTYIPYHKTEKYYKRYGMDIIEKIRKKCKYNINIVRQNQYGRKQMAKIYNKCFCGLRMTEHDGLPNQVIEMGLMGRRSFYNGNIPGSVKWDKNNIDKIIDCIEKESTKIGTIDYLYAKEIREFITVGDRWLDTNFWE